MFFFFLMIRLPPGAPLTDTLFPYTTLCRSLVARIREALVAAVEVPVTLKIRTGWDATHRNAPAIARIAWQSGIAALAIHGRSREQHYAGSAEYDTIAAIKAATPIDRKSTRLNSSH